MTNARKTMLTVAVFPIAVGALAASMASGCASAPLPVGRIASSEAAVRAAKEVGAEEVPTAALYLKFAQEQLETAKRLIANGENAKGELVLRRAEADAEVAVALSRENVAKAEATQELTKTRNLNTPK